MVYALVECGQVYGLCCHIQIKPCKAPSVPKASHYHQAIRRGGEISMAPSGAAGCTPKHQEILKIPKLLGLEGP